MKPSFFKKLVSKAPTGPGIYIFTGPADEKLYTGKASNIRTRLSSYTKTNDRRLLKMLSLAKNIKTLETDSEIEALILESQYIKRHKPAFNIMLRDDKQYFYVVFTKEKFPKIFLSHQPHKFLISKSEFLNKSQTPNPKNKNNPANYWKLKIRNWKFHSATAEWVGPFTDGTALKTTLRYLRRMFPYCTCKQPHHNYCLNYHIGKCLGFCCLKINQKSNIKNQNDRLKIKNIYQKNVGAIKDILSGKRILLIKKLEKEMIKLGRRERFEEAADLRNKIEKIKKVFENASVIRNLDLFRNSKLEIRNLRAENNDKSPLVGFKKLLKLDHLPVRIEGYDISNIQGAHATGSMVVFENGIPDKSQYRKFKIRGKRTPDDTFMLSEILQRRFNHPEWPTPDLMLVDGGKQQLRVAEVVVNSKFKTLNPKQIPNSKFQIPKIIALTKNEKHRGEKIYVGGEKKAIPLSKLPANVKNLLLQIGAEAHRFATSYYRKLHRKNVK